MSEDQDATLQDLITDVRTCMITTVDDDGVLVSRPMSTQEAEFDGDLWFVVGAGSDLVREVRQRPQVNVAYAGSRAWVSVAGDGEVVHDRSRLRELWNPVLDAWFPEGPDEAEAVAVRVAATSAQYWTSPGGRVATAISLVKAKVTGERYEGGESETVQL